MLGPDPRAVPVLTRTGQLPTVLADEDGRHLQGSQGRRRLPHPRLRADEDDALGSGGGQAKALGEPAHAQAVDRDGHHDGDEDQRHERPGLGGQVDEAVLGIRPLRGVLELQREDARDRSRDDAPGSHTRREQPLLPGGAGAEQGQEHADGTHDEHQQGDEQERGGAHVDHLIPAHPPGEHDEEHTDQEDLQVLLELLDVIQVHPWRVAQGDTQEGDGEQPALRLHRAGDGQRPHRHGQEDHTLEEAGDEMPPHGLPQDHGGDTGDEHRHPRGDEQGQGRGPEGVLLTADEDGLVDQDSQHGPDRVDHDPLPP